MWQGHLTLESGASLAKDIELLGGTHIYYSQSVALRNDGRFEQSWFESIDPLTNTRTRFDKVSVFACEPDRADYDILPDLLVYMSTVIQRLPLLGCARIL
jgi:hypothetical protein